MTRHVVVKVNDFEPSISVTRCLEYCFHYLATLYDKRKLKCDKCAYKIVKVGPNFEKYKINPQKFAKEAKFRQIWSHCLTQERKFRCEIIFVKWPLKQVFLLHFIPWVGKGGFYTSCYITLFWPVSWPHHLKVVTFTSNWVKYALNIAFRQFGRHYYSWEIKIHF